MWVWSRREERESASAAGAVIELHHMQCGKKEAALCQLPAGC